MKGLWDFPKKESDPVRARRYTETVEDALDVVRTRAGREAESRSESKPES